MAFTLAACAVVKVSAPTINAPNAENFLKEKVLVMVILFSKLNLTTCFYHRRLTA